MQFPNVESEQNNSWASGVFGATLGPTSRDKGY